MTPAELKAAWRAGTLGKPDYLAGMLAARRPLHEFADLLAGTAIARIELTEGRVCFVTREPELRLIVPPDDPRLVATDLLNFDAFEAAELALLRRLTPPGGVVFDVGANVGWVAMNLAKAMPGISIHAFEPVPGTYKLLLEHLALNGIANVTAHPFGFGRRAGVLGFHVPHEGVNASLKNLTGNPDVRLIAGRVELLEDFVRLRKLPPDVLKIDVEGAERDVLEGGQEVLRQHRPVVCCELVRKWMAHFGHHPNETIALMRRCGYDCFRIRGGGLDWFPVMDDTTVETNFFFLHAERHADAIASLTRRG